MNKYDFRILIIDDNLDIHQDFIKILTNPESKSSIDALSRELFGENHEESNAVMLPQFEIVTVPQGEDGVNEIANAIKQGRPYSLAFVDIRMPPGWDGIKTIKHIWELDKDIQVVICTAYSDYSWEKTISELGQSDNLLILKKPFDNITVRQLACALTRKWQLVQESRSYTSSLECIVESRTEQLKFQATHDPLTELPNRVFIEGKINEAIEHCENRNLNFAIIFFDLDRFKLVNDSLSHHAGDELLHIVARRLESQIRPGDTLARIGGDEFIMLVTDIKKQENIISIVSKILATIKQNIMINKHNLTVTSSIGISVYPQDGRTLDELIKNADTAMYYAKELGGNQFQFYTAKMNQDNLERLEMELDLRNAILNNELYLFFQPQFNISNNSITAVEALIRWQHPKKGLILPIQFIPMAEESGLIISIGEWVLREACRQNKAWQDAGLQHIRVAVNITTQQLRQFDFVDRVKMILDESKLEAKYLELELTENSLINNANAIKVIHQFREMGIQIALDDFGMGFANLNQIKKIPIDRLKIDRSFIQNIQVNHTDEVIIQSIIDMAGGLNLEVLAEGVETKKQFNFLKMQDCNNIQGFYLSHPISVTEVGELLKNASDQNKVVLDNPTEKETP